MGDGFATAARYGSVAHDEIVRRAGRIAPATARARRIEASMSTGQPIRVRAAMKPFSSVPQPLATVDLASGEAAVAIKQRTDVCAVPAGGSWGRRSSPSSSRTRRSRSSAATPSRRRGGTSRRSWRRCRDRLPGGDAGRGQVHGRRELAGALGVPFVDLDAEIEREAGASADIFRDEGEPAFRALEAAALVKASMEDPPSSRAAAAASCSNQPTGSPSGTRAWPSTSTSRSRSCAAGSRRPRIVR